MTFFPFSVWQHLVKHRCHERGWFDGQASALEKLLQTPKCSVEAENPSLDIWGYFTNINIAHLMGV
jgi:hypothetical protein